MKKNSKIGTITKLSLLLVFVLFSNMMLAQMSLMNNSLNGFTVQDEEGEDGKKKKKDKKRKDEFKVFVGANFNQLNIADERYYSNMGVGWDIGFSYKRGRFFYWQIGAQYNNPVYVVKDLNVLPDSSSFFDGVFGVKSIPSLLFVPKDGQPQMAMGALPKDTFEKAIKDVLGVEK